MSEAFLEASLRKRFEAKFVPVTESGCWLWLGAWSWNGYGYIEYRKKKLRAHRVSWELHRGAIAGGLHVCHQCDVPACVNPDHLFLGTRGDNMLDCHRKGRSPVSKAIAAAAAMRRAQTHCKHGHLLSGDNLYVIEGVGRLCKACNAKRNRERQRCLRRV